MRKLFFIAIAFACTATFGQGNNLWDVEMVQAKTGKGNAYEKAWKAHVIKFHNGDDKRYAEEIMSGPNNGNILVASGPYSLADMDKERANGAAHTADYDLTVSPSVESAKTWGTYRWVDTLSYNGDVKAEKFITTVYHLKAGKLPDLVSEIKRALAVNKKINSPTSYNTYIKMWGGSSPELVTVTNLKDGFKQLDNKFDPNMASRNKDFQTTYVQEYGQAAWDNRSKLLPEITTSYETYISKNRKDLSSVTK
jgi:hypothetical protein